MDRPTEACHESAVGDCDVELAAYVEHRLSPAASRQVEQHLDTCEECRSVVAVLAVPGTRRPPRLAPGDQIDQFTILRRLGSGGMGVVYAAQDGELDREVALKLIHPAGAATHSHPTVPGTVLGALRVEAKTLARLSHRNVVTVFAIGGSDDRPYLAMELVRGPSLRVWLALQRRSVAEISRMFAQAARGLGAAHRAGVVHRDFKPDNVLVGADAEVRVVDFGLARIAAETTAFPSDTHAKTSTGGTPSYMAPEQRAGDPADARSDQYAFCLSLHEALNGHLPDAPTRDRRARGRVPVQLRRAITRGLATDPDDRWPEMDALLPALDSAGKSSARLVGWVGASALAIFAGAWVLSHRDPSGCVDVPSEIERLRATGSAAVTAYIGEWEAAYDDACRTASAPAKACLRGLATELELALRADPGGDGLVDAVPLPSDCLRRSGMVASDPVLEVRLDAVKAAVDRHAVDDAERQARAVAADARARGAPMAEANALKFTAWALEERGALDEADEVLRDALTIAGSIDADELAGTLWTQRASVSYAARGDPREALQLLEAAELALVRGDAMRSLAASHLLQTRGQLHHEMGHVDVAVADLERAAELMEYHHGPNHPELVAVLVPLALRIFERDGADAAARVDDLLQRSLALSRSRQEHDPFREAGVLNALARVDKSRGDAGAAAQKVRRAIELLTAGRSGEHPSVGTMYRNLGTLLLDEGETAEALVELRRAHAILSRAHGKAHPALASVHRSLGRAHRATGDLALACEAFGAEVRAVELGSGPSSAALLEPLRRLAECQTERGDEDAARATQRRAEGLSPQGAKE